MNPWISFFVSLVSAAGSVIGVIAFFQNRRDRMKKENAEREQIEFYNSLVKEVQDHCGGLLVWTFDPGSKYFDLAEKLVMRGQLEREPGQPGTYSLKTEKIGLL